MNSQTISDTIQMLTYLLIPIIIGIFGLIIFLVIWYMKQKSKKTNQEQGKSEKTSVESGSNKQSIFNFMEFEKVEDNMIVQKNGRRFLMVIGCQGINYDLMSEIERNSVEAGFVQFLNTLRDPIQIYIQTRAVNLEDSLQKYKAKVTEIENKYMKMKMQYEDMKESGNYTEEQIHKAYFELTKQSNLREYGISIIKDTERMSLNKNILNQSYYIIVQHYVGVDEKYDKEEIINIAFSELYTKCQSMISSLSVCGVRGKILRTEELIELLYMAYNREDAEVFGIDKAYKAGYDEIYSSAPDVYAKMIKGLDKKIEDEAMKLARQKINEAKSELQIQAEEKADNIDEFINNVAKLIIEENEQYIGKNVKETAINKVEKTKEGGKENGKKTGRGIKATTK